MSSAADGVAERVLAGRKYRFIHPPVIRRLAAEALASGRRPKDAEKAVRRRLHQVYGAFAGGLDHERLAALVEEVVEDPGRAGEVARRIATMHSSTAERLSSVERFYPSLVGAVRPRAVLDLGCGLHPFCLPWMGLEEDAAYYAVDIDVELIRLVDRYLGAIGRRGGGVAADLLEESPPVAPDGVEADLVLLLKMVPGLERQRAGTAAAIVGAFPAAWIALSCPRSSLGGRDRGMDDHYSRLMAAVIGAAGRTARVLSFPRETVWLCPPRGMAEGPRSRPGC